MQNKTNRPSGMFGFSLVWLGQIVSVLATSMTTFALTIWVFEKTGSATLLVFLSCFGGVIAGVAGYLNSATRNAESILPDHDELSKAEAATA